MIDLRLLARSNYSGGFVAGSLVRHILKRSDLPRGLPVFGRPPGDRLYVVLSLLGQFALPRKPVLNSAWAGIVGSGRKAKIAELLDKITQESR